MKSMALALWKYRQFILSSIYNEYSARYSRSHLGFAWIFIGPLVQASMFALVFSGILSSRLSVSGSEHSYILYLLAGLMGWNLFSDVVTRSTTLFVDQGNLIKKMYFPRVTLVAVVAGIGIINNAVTFLITLLLSFVLGTGFGWLVFWLLPLYLVLFALALGVGLILGVLNVFIRDIGLSLPIGLQLFFWATPVIYPIDVIPLRFRGLIEVNPLYAIVSGFQHVLVFGEPPHLLMLLSCAALAALLLPLSLYMFRQANAEMADAL